MLLTYMHLSDSALDGKDISALAAALAVRNAMPLLGHLTAPPVLSHKPSGQPYLEGCEQVKISISHSGGHVLVGASEKRIGVDLERISGLRENVMKRAFSRHERLYTERSADPDRAFFEVWTRKEAYAKACSEGLRRVMLAMVCDEIGLCYRMPGPDGEPLYCKAYDDVPEVATCVCCAERSFAQRIAVFEPDDSWLNEHLPDRS